MKKPIEVMAIPSMQGKPFPAPFYKRLADSEWRGLSQYFGLSKLGVNVEVMAPGAQSSLKHWHSHSEELVYVISGELTLIIGEQEFVLSQGMCMGMPPGEHLAHHMCNRSAQEASFLVVGSRDDNDEVTYPDDDIKWIKQGESWQAVHKDGRPYSQK